MELTRRVGLFLTALALVGLVTGASAQTPVGGLVLEGNIDVGGRLVAEPEKNERAFFEMYRDMSPGFWLGDLRLRLHTKDEAYSTELGGRNWFLEDQEYRLSGERLGLARGGFEWIQIPHTLSTNARSLATDGDLTTQLLPTPRPPLAQHNLASEKDIFLRWDVMRLFFTLTPTPDIDVLVEYTRTHKHGDRPYSAAMSTPGGNFYEILQPIDQVTNDVRFTAGISRETWQLQFSYVFSFLDNAFDAVVADNPCFGNPSNTIGVGCGPSTGGPTAQAQGRVSLPPSNHAHTVSLAGGVTLPWWSTRISGNASYSLRFQDDAFLPHTINPAISSPALALPASSLDGKAGLATVNVNVTSRPLRPLTLSLRYRLFDYNDMTDELIFEGNVENDNTLRIEERRAARYEYTRQNLDLDARWRIVMPLSVGVGGGWERWDRNDHREVTTSNEYFAKATIDWAPWEWLATRLTYKPSFRRIGDYNTFAHLAHTVVEEEPTAVEMAQSQSVLLRKYDEADRNRQRVDGLIQILTWETVTAGVTGSYMVDDYPNSPLGLQDAHGWNAGFDVSWAPTKWVSLAGGYVHEFYEATQRSRSRPVTGTTTLDAVDFDWVSDTGDEVDTFYVTGRATLIPGTLFLDVGLRYSFATSSISTFNPITPTSGTAAQDTTATAKPYPDVKTSLLRFDTWLRWNFWKNLTASLGYAFESFDNQTYRTDDLDPFIVIPGLAAPGVTSIWLGNDVKSYKAHILTMTLGLRF